MISRKYQQGLTLFELLIVIIIVVVLIGMLYPWGPGDRVRKARTMLCLSNLRQSTMALALYAVNNTNEFPNLDQQTGNDGPAGLFLLTNYAQSPRVFICPFVDSQRQKVQASSEKKFVPVLDRAFFISNGNDYAYYDGLRTNSFTNAIMADRYAWADRTSIDKKLLNHPDRFINVGFVDGHVEHIKPNILIGTNYTPAWSRIQDPLRVP